MLRIVVEGGSPSKGRKEQNGQKKAEHFYIYACGVAVIESDIHYSTYVQAMTAEGKIADQADKNNRQGGLVNRSAYHTLDYE